MICFNKNGFEQTHVKDHTEKGVLFFEALFDNIRQKGLPPVGLNLLMGENFMERIGNVHKNLKEKRIELQSGIATIRNHR